MWNVAEGGGPSMVVSRNLGVGKVFTTRFAGEKEVAFRLAVAGSKGAMQIWDTSTNTAVMNAFAGRLGVDGRIGGEESEVGVENGEGGGRVEERVIGVDEDSSDDEDEGDVEPGGGNGDEGDGWESMED